MATVHEIEETKALVREGILTAPPAFMATPNEKLGKCCNGCGAADALFDFVPDTIWGLFIGWVCHIHDFEYRVGETLKHKAAADLRMLLNGIRLFHHHGSGWLLFPRMIRMTFYYVGVKLFGKSAFYGS